MEIIIPKEVKLILDKLYENGFKAYAVGGCVRDSLIGREINDWDICSSALPEQMVEVFKGLCKIVPTGIKHGTLTLIINNQSFEVTTFRVDGEYLDNRRPESVSFTSDITEDLSRRDFCINAMAFNVIDGLVDPYKGQVDLQNKVIRCVGDAEKRFTEDALRMLRCIRFACQLGFEIDTYTYESLKRKKDLIENISMERIRDELCKILLSERAPEGVNKLYETGMLSYIIPELCKCYGFNQHNKYHDKDIFNHTLSVLDNTPEKLEIRLAALLHDISKPECFTMDNSGAGHFYKHDIKGAKAAENILRRLKFDNSVIKKVCILIKEHMNKLQQNFSDAAVKKLINRVGIENLDDLFDLQIADLKGSSKIYQDISSIDKLRKVCQRILEEKEPISLSSLEITGSDLMELGYVQGKEIGRVLNSLMNLVIENKELNNKDTLIKLAENMKKFNKKQEVE